MAANTTFVDRELFKIIRITTKNTTSHGQLVENRLMLKDGGKG